MPLCAVLFAAVEWKAGENLRRQKVAVGKIVGVAAVCAEAQPVVEQLVQQAQRGLQEFEEPHPDLAMAGSFLVPDFQDDPTRPL
jgi:hypothetical protein